MKLSELIRVDLCRLIKHRQMNVRTKDRSSNLKILLNVTCKTNALNPIVFFGNGVEVRRYE